MKIEGDHGELELLFTAPNAHSRDVGHAAWRAIEERYPQVRIWGLVTPYFETRNIHFYVNRCGFHIVEFFNSHHPDPNEPEHPGSGEPGDGASEGGRPNDSDEGMLRFEKILQPATTRSIRTPLSPQFTASLLSWLSDLRLRQPNSAFVCTFQAVAHSHSIVAGGLEVTSRTTRFTSGTVFVMRVEILASTS